MRHRWLLVLSALVLVTALLVYLIVFPAAVSRINSFQSAVHRVHISVEVTKETSSAGNLEFGEIQFRKLTPVGAPPGWDRVSTRVFNYSYGSLTVWYTITEYSYSGFEEYMERISDLMGKRIDVQNPVRGYVVLVDTSSVPDLALPLLNQLLDKELDEKINELADENSLEIVGKYQEGDLTIWRARAVITVSSETQEIPVYIKAKRVDREDTVAIAIVTYPSGTVTVTESQKVGRLSITVSGRIRLDYETEADEFLGWVSNCGVSTVG